MGVAVGWVTRAKVAAVGGTQTQLLTRGHLIAPVSLFFSALNPEDLSRGSSLAGAGRGPVRGQVLVNLSSSEAALTLEEAGKCAGLRVRLQCLPDAGMP